MDIISSIVGKINGFLWDFALLFLLCGTGIYFTIRLKFVQIAKFKDGWDRTFGGLSLRGKAADKEGMSSFQSLATAIAAQVGTGNLAGAATALIAGGPGAIFWMWLSAFFGMATIFVEASLGQQYKTVTESGNAIGGPAYYIKAAFKGPFGKFLAGLFAIFIILALGFMGNMVQSNSISGAFVNAFPQIKPIYIGIACALVAAFIFIGGLKRIASFAEKTVPIMALFYIIGSVIILIMNIKNLPSSIVLIFTSAFNPQAVIGGGLGIGVQQAMRYGVARGLFSNEAGMGSTPHAHALAKVKHPCEQGVVAMIGVFFDTFIVVTLTALVILSSDILQTKIYPLDTVSAIPETLKGVGLPQAAFSNGFGFFGVVFVAVCLLFFAFTTIIGWYFFGEQNVKYLFGEKAVKVYAVLVVGFILLGSVLKVDLVWDLADCFNGLMVIPNLLGILALSGIVGTLFKEYNNLNKK
ncbi:sodium:alanine symporter family protein [Brachyspira aalborgi]|uniref:Sodium:alanine symporter family protein n=1 Tax=Brachyspira aalborgi TaxID=29522 RepID=A0A5C8FT26_9SPIR|nr:sodium:alanine symporter family protein [Brachyspira aalborgi]TXJ52793.1 sodium:alanine symporter family protein [Brachyspira aalborgi]TXJ60776.1 sodium:alanine symporter family protein [Brachyspira aalborgi]